MAAAVADCRSPVRRPNVCRERQTVSKASTRTAAIATDTKPAINRIWIEAFDVGLSGVTVEAESVTDSRDGFNHGWLSRLGFELAAKVLDV